MTATLSTGIVPVGAGEDYGVGRDRPGISLARPTEQEAGGETFLGFRPGEEIRYTLERADGARLGVRTMWGIRLEEFDRETGLFALTEETIELGRSAGPGQGQIGTLMSQTTATTPTATITPTHSRRLVRSG